MICSFHEQYGYALKRKTVVRCLFESYHYFSLLIAIRTKTIRVSDEEVSAKVRNSSLFSLNVLTGDVSIPVRYSWRNTIV